MSETAGSTADSPAESESYLQKAENSVKTAAENAVMNSVKNDAKSFFSSNVILIGIGIILGIGALLISQKKTIVQVGAAVSKAGEVMGAA